MARSLLRVTVAPPRNPRCIVGSERAPIRMGHD